MAQTSAQTTAGPDVLIRRLVAHGRVPTGSTAEPVLREALRERLAGPLEQALAATGDQGFWLIRKLEVRACVGGGWTAGQMADVVARSVADVVGHRARRGGNAAEVVWFPDRASFWAQYLLDLARGQVHGRWEYAGFATATSWADGATTLARQDGPGLAAALQRLSPPELDELTGRVAADPLLESVADGTRSAGAVLSALRLLREQGRLAVGGSTGLLLAVTAACGSGRGGEPLRLLASVARPALDVAALLRLVAGAGTGSATLLSGVAQGLWSEVARIAGGDDFLGLVSWSAPERAALVDTLTSRPVAASRDRWHTRFGGAFVLLPLCAELWSWREATAAWPQAEGEAGEVPADRLAQLGVLAAAMGAARFDAALGDPALRAVLDIPGDLDVHVWLDDLDPTPFVELTGLDLTEEVDPWLASSPAFLGAAAAVLLRELGRRLPGMATASPAYLWHNVLDLEAWVSTETEEGTGLRTGLVELGHAPMGVLLSLSGLGRGELTVEGAGVGRWTLTSRS